MKGRGFLIVGGIMAAGIIAYGAYRCIYGGRKNDSENTQDTAKKDALNSEFCPSVEIYVSPDVELKKTKVKVISSVSERHYEGAKAMEESLNSVFRENDEDIIVTENKEALDRISGELDRLLE